jgi:hypothetical protein
MVRAAQRPIIVNPLRNPETKATGTISHAFKSVMTLHPIDQEAVSKSYIPSVLYMVILMAVSMSIFSFSFYIFSGSLPYSSNFLVVIGNYIVGCMIMLCLSFCISVISSYLAGVDHSAKFYIIIVSSVTYLPFIILIKILSEFLDRITTFITLILCSYYMQQCFSAIFQYEDQRAYVIHYAWTIFGYFVLEFVGKYVVFNSLVSFTAKGN